MLSTILCRSVIVPLLSYRFVSSVTVKAEDDVIPADTVVVNPEAPTTEQEEAQDHIVNPEMEGYVSN